MSYKTLLSVLMDSDRHVFVLVKIISLKTAIVVCFMLCIFVAHGQTNSEWFWVADDHERSRGLPPGLPRTVETNGDVDGIPDHFTTQAYQNEAARLMLSEANQVAQTLHLEDELPLTRSNIMGVNVAPFGFFYRDGLMGSVVATNYTYRFLSSGKLDRIEINNGSQVLQDCENALVPESQMNSHAAYQLATQWLSSLSVDVNGLNRDCQLTIASPPVFNCVGNGKEPIRRMFAPVYDIGWKSTNVLEPDATVQLYLPDKMLIQMSIDDSKHDLRPPLIFTNLAALFPGHAKITTNYPTTPIVVSPWAPPFTEANFITDSNQPEPSFHDIPLSRWIRTQTLLNTNNLSLSQLVTWKKVSGPDEWGVATFEVPIPFDALNYHSDKPFPNGSVDLGRLDTNGNFIEVTFSDIKKASDGNTLVEWNINWNSPGWYDLRARLMYEHGFDGDDFNLIGPPLHYYSSNACRFYEDSTLFTDDGSDLYASLREPTAKYRIKITNPRGRLINDILGSTTNGEINLAWDLTGLDGQKYTNNSFIGYFYVTYPDDTRTNPPVKAHFNKIGTSGH